MSGETTPIISGGASFQAYTNDQLRVLGFLFLKGKEVPEAEVTSTVILHMVRDPLEVLRVLSRQGCVRLYADGWALTQAMHQLLCLGALLAPVIKDIGAYHLTTVVEQVPEGVRHVR